MLKQGRITERSDVQPGAWGAEIREGRKTATDKDGEPLRRIFATESAFDNYHQAELYLARHLSPDDPKGKK